MWNYASKRELDYGAGVDTSDLVVKKDLIDLKTEVEKLDINGLASAPTKLNNLKTKVDALDVGNLKTGPADLKKLSDVDNEIIKNTKFNTLKTKLNHLKEKIPDATTLIHINQYNMDRQSLEKQIRDVDKKY